MGAMHIRRVTEDDWRAVRDIRLRAMAADPGAFTSSGERERSFTEPAWRLRLRGSPWYLAFEGADDGADAATPDGDAPALAVVSVIPEPGRAADDRHVVGLWVDPAARRSGVGTALLHRAASDAHDGGARTLSLWVAEDNEPAQRLYRSLGLGPTDERVAWPRDLTRVEVRWEGPLPLVGAEVQGSGAQGS